MKFLVTADNNGAIGRGEQPLVTIPAVQQGFLKETQGKVVVMGRKTLEGCLLYTSRLSEDEELLLKGRIDRLDLCEDEKHVYVKIIDYKSGNTSFDLAALYYGCLLYTSVFCVVPASTKATAVERTINDPVSENCPASILRHHDRAVLYLDKDSAAKLEE